MADEEIVTAAPRGLTVEERNKPILDVIGDQSIGNTNISDLGGGLTSYLPQTVQTNEQLADTGRTLALSGANKEATQVSAGDTASVQTGTFSPESKASLISGVPDTSTEVSAIQKANTVGSVSQGSYLDDTEINAIQDLRTREQLLGAGTLATAATQDLDQRATTKYQLEQIYSSLETGKPLPAWASPNVRKVQEIMNARGLGASSVASAAMVQAIAESALPIAVQDANKYSAIQLANLTNEQQAVLSNAASMAALNSKNLDVRMQAAKTNAETFLKMDLLDTTNEQQSSILKYQSEVQGLFTEASAENARLQFNAKNQTQVNEFYDNLGMTVSKNNADRETATQQFNSDQSNSMNKYNAKLEDAREKFNSNMQLQIDQSNAVWRRTINTANTAGQNDSNKLNSAALLGMTAQAQNNLWQKYRDEASFSFQSTQNDLQRTHQLATVAIANQFASDMFDTQLDAESNAAMSKFMGNVLTGVFKKAADSLGSFLFDDNKGTTQ